jgi:nucleoside 2-deoxyribosyltransferase
MTETVIPYRSGTPFQVYMASPLGFSEAGRLLLDRFKALFVQHGLVMLDPWSLPDQRRIDAILAMPYGVDRRDAWAAMNPTIAAMNAQAIRMADGLLAVLDGVDVDSGTASEIGFAFGRGIPMLGYRGDFRLSADNEGSAINLQVEYFLKTSGRTDDEIQPISTSLATVEQALASFMALMGERRREREALRQ